ncbi:hypothetical protein [Carboxylicivirga linearis]|uniref:Uncharacterized protein n=1 Tax=Carboxylicivirga linearis TaxID=1628157 RepID=A0ABS5K0P8_9BACT|nr:hypothetical protein [Carboxylicivirga linearis]MBS2100693.1 hypothetical protein [Carboxylicivirga linearis]
MDDKYVALSSYVTTPIDLIDIDKCTPIKDLLANRQKTYLEDLIFKLLSELLNREPSIDDFKCVNIIYHNNAFPCDSTVSYKGIELGIISYHQKFEGCSVKLIYRFTPNKYLKY